MSQQTPVKAAVPALTNCASPESAPATGTPASSLKRPAGSSSSPPTKSRNHRLESPASEGYAATYFGYQLDETMVRSTKMSPRSFANARSHSGLRNASPSPTSKAIPPLSCISHFLPTMKGFPLFKKKATKKTRDESPPRFQAPDSPTEAPDTVSASVFSSSFYSTSCPVL